MSFEFDEQNQPGRSDAGDNYSVQPAAVSDEAQSAVAEQLQTKVAAVRQIVRELCQLSQEACAVANLIESRLVEAAKDDNDDATLRLSFQALVRMLDDAEHEYMLSDRVDELAVMVGLEAAEVAHG